MGDELEYIRAGTNSINSSFKEKTHTNLMPTGRMNIIFVAIIVIVFVLWAITFPFDSIISGDIQNFDVSIGIPFKFLRFNIVNAKENPLKIFPFIFDLLIYIAIAYIIDILIKVTLERNPNLAKIEKNSKEKIELFDNKKINVVEVK